uniref:Copper transport protein ATOX1 n=2 Tax=Acrobeloides nanus TaxID=290746 RepID=A0A914DLQ1_9BILA
MTNTYTYHVEMTCGGCSNAVQKVLGKLGDKVTNVDINLQNKTVAVTTDLSSQEILEALQKTGKAVNQLS